MTNSNYGWQAYKKDLKVLNFLDAVKDLCVPRSRITLAKKRELLAIFHPGLTTASRRRGTPMEDCDEKRIHAVFAAKCRLMTQYDALRERTGAYDREVIGEHGDRLTVLAQYGESPFLPKLEEESSLRSLADLARKEEELFFIRGDIPPHVQKDINEGPKFPGAGYDKNPGADPDL